MPAAITATTGSPALKPAFHLLQRQGFEAEPVRKACAARGQHHRNRHCQALPRLCRRMVEK